ncbi:hypothetical protein GPZ77_34090 [Streptomyces sp. QHH-9511]|uniref:hypothetical protein n=1 Tax=Streptomyces sp. QHH-9511 TaxID=2684468 RepID=UPI001315B1AE|nr:hypothetical protein [Streptomyces sp. QHH-9511]QGZ52646.1 hypothetical protein GPZ77_34090 [Streptomyces sp. QHH-9511]
MTASLLLAPLGGLLSAALGLATEAPWWMACALGFGGILILRAEALVNARNEARRGLHENRLLGEVSRKQALDYLREIRQSQQPVRGAGADPEETA